MTKIEQIQQRIVSQFDPDRIILFGSRATDHFRPDSDYDVCVLKEKIDSKRQLTHDIYKTLFGLNVAVDVIVDTPSHFETMKDKWFYIYHHIAKTGRTIYEK